MEIQNLERRNSEYALFESQRERTEQNYESWKNVLCSMSTDHEQKSAAGSGSKITRTMRVY